MLYKLDSNSISILALQTDATLGLQRKFARFESRDQKEEIIMNADVLCRDRVET